MISTVRFRVPETLKPGLGVGFPAYSPTWATKSHFLLVLNSKLLLTPSQFLLPFLNILCSFWRFTRARIIRNVFSVPQISYTQGHSRLPIITMERCTLIRDHEVLPLIVILTWYILLCLILCADQIWKTVSLKCHVVPILGFTNNIMSLSHIFLFVCLLGFYNHLKMSNSLFLHQPYENRLQAKSHRH